jgi:hypothetical protein
VKRVIATLGALMLAIALGSAAQAQTSTQFANYNHYLSNHPGATTASPVTTNPVMGNASNYMTSFGGMQNRNTVAAQAQYQKNLQKYNYYLAMHPGMTNTSPYASTYPGLQNYAGYAPTQALASSPIMATLAPFLGNYSGMQNAGYGAVPMQTGYAAMPMQQAYAPMPMQPAYAAAPYFGNGGFRAPYPGYGAASGYGPMAFGNHYYRHHAAMAAMFANHGAGAGGWGSRSFAAARHQRWLQNH